MNVHPNIQTDHYVCFLGALEKVGGVVGHHSSYQHYAYSCYGSILLADIIITEYNFEKHIKTSIT